MIFNHIEDWDNAYANTIHIAQGKAWPESWMLQLQAFHDVIKQQSRIKLDIVYDAQPRLRFDLFSFMAVIRWGWITPILRIWQKTHRVWLCGRYALM